MEKVILVFFCSVIRTKQQQPQKQKQQCRTLTWKMFPLWISWLSSFVASNAPPNLTSALFSLVSPSISLCIEGFLLSFRFGLAVNSDPKSLLLNSSIISLFFRFDVVDAVFRVSFLRPYHRLIGIILRNLSGFSYAVQDGDTLMPQCIVFFSYWRRKWEDWLYALGIFYCIFLVGFLFF